MYIDCHGVHGPTVIMESGIGGFSLDWLKVRGLLQPQQRHCAYDRAGYGLSTSSSFPRVSSQIADELHDLLLIADVPPPYVLVGHSFGGYNVRYFASAWPEKVAGVVLVDSSHPEQFERLPFVQVSAPTSPEQTATFFRHVSAVDMSVLTLHPEAVRAQVAALMSMRKSARTQHREHLTLQQSAQDLTWLPFPDQMPLAVIRRGRRVWDQTPLGNAKEKAWREMQEDLTSLSQRSILLVADYSGHLVHLEEPDVVVQAIEWTIHQGMTP